jgi:transcriptional regulator with XRE-family HTH domain
MSAAQRKRFGRHLRQLRKQAGLSLRELGKKAKVGYLTLWRVEHAESDLSMWEWERVQKVLRSLSVEGSYGRTVEVTQDDNCRRITLGGLTGEGAAGPGDRIPATLAPDTAR